MHIIKIPNSEIQSKSISNSAFLLLFDGFKLPHSVFRSASPLFPQISIAEVSQSQRRHSVTGTGFEFFFSLNLCSPVALLAFSTFSPSSECPPVPPVAGAWSGPLIKHLLGNVFSIADLCLTPPKKASDFLCHLVPALDFHLFQDLEPVCFSFNLLQFWAFSGGLSHLVRQFKGAFYILPGPLPSFFQFGDYTDLCLSSITSGV